MKREVYLSTILFALYAQVHCIFTVVSKATSFNMKRTLLMTMSNLPRRMPTAASLKGANVLKCEGDRVTNCIKFLNASPEPFNCVATISDRLSSVGFIELDEGNLWRKSKSIKRGGKYYFKRNGSTIVAFTVGTKFEPGNGFKIIGAHVDSPNLKLKPCTQKSANNLIQLSVECYGGGLWHTWFDRDLSLAGRVILRRQSDSNTSQRQTFETKLVKIDRPILRIPSLCIHLRTQEERDAFKVNKEDHLVPILCDEVEKSLSIKNDAAQGDKSIDIEETEKDQWASAQQPQLLTLLAHELQCSVEEIADFELSLYDVQGASTSGLNSEYLCGSRIDNLASCFVAVEALERHALTGLADDEDVSVIALFDHEEVGQHM